jgi:CheY-like chemotaxis protein
MKQGKGSAKASLKLLWEKITMFETTGVAVAAVMIPEEKLIRVLVIDDEEPFQQDMSDYFGAYGYSVDVASNLDEAKSLLEKNEYQIILADVNFEGLELKGDRFVLTHYKNFQGARVVIVTGLNINELRNHDALDNLKIPIWSKGDPNWGTNLTELTEATANTRKQELASQLNDFMSDKLGGSGNYIVTGAPAAVSAAAVGAKAAPITWELAIEDILVGWLESQSNPERPFFSVGRTVLSASKMVEQVKQKTEIGRELLEMFVTEIKYSLGLGDKPISRR